MDNNPQDPNSGTPFPSPAGGAADIPQPGIASPTPPSQIPGIDPAAPAAPISNPTDPLSATPNAFGSPTGVPSAQPDPSWPASSGPAAAPPELATQPPMASNPTPDPMASNPFLQSQAPGAIPGVAPAQNTAPTSPEQFGAIETPPAAPPAFPSPSVGAPPTGLPQDPMNTAFAPPPNSNEANPFAAPTPQGPSLPQPSVQTEAPAPASTPFGIPAAEPQNPIADMALGAAPTNAPDAQAAVPPPASPTGEQIPPTSQPGALDLSALQANNNPAPQAGAQPAGTPLPEMGPVENAPTDLSHLIAGDEGHQQPAGIYTPPVAQDQTPPASPASAPAAGEGDTPPPGKHLNLTKVLLIAGIPIILIVAALSAYLILGVGKQAPSEDTTSLPVEQSTPEQAPLTNPPQQITAPSPVTIPEPQTQTTIPAGPESSASGSLPIASSSPGGSLSPAMQAAQRQPSPSPAASAATTLP